MTRPRSVTPDVWPPTPTPHEVGSVLRDPEGQLWEVASVGVFDGEWYAMLVGRSRGNRRVVSLLDARPR